MEHRATRAEEDTKIQRIQDMAGCPKGEYTVSYLTLYNMCFFISRPSDPTSPHPAKGKAEIQLAKLVKIIFNGIKQALNQFSF